MQVLPGLARLHRSLVLSGVFTLLSCGGGLRQPTRLVDVPGPTICEQIADHVDAYIGYVGCAQPRYGGAIGYVATVAELGEVGIDCSEVNGVARLPYKSERVDAVTFAVMREELFGDLGLYSAIEAIALASLSDGALPTDRHDEAGRRQVEQQLRDRFRSVPALYQPLVAEIAERLDAEDSCSVAVATPNITVASLPSILEALAPTEDRDGCVKRGLMNFSADNTIDPNIAVAIARLQRGNMAYVPTLSELEAMLRSMNVVLQD